MDHFVDKAYIYNLFSYRHTGGFLPKTFIYYNTVSVQAEHEFLTFLCWLRYFGKYLLLNFIFNGTTGLEILYLSINLVFNSFDTRESSSESIFALHPFKLVL